MAANPEQPAFFFDLGDPGCYLVAERILAELALLAEWIPVSARQLGWEPAAPDPVQLARVVAQQGLQPLRLPADWPPDSEAAMLACTFAKGGGRTVAFGLAAFRQVFAGGRDLGDEGTVLIAGAACEMHPRSLLKGMGMRSVRESLRQASERARDAGVRELPAIVAGDLVFQGPGALDEAIEALGAVTGASPH